MTPSSRSQLNAERPPWWEVVYYYCILSVPMLPVLSYYFNAFCSDCPNAAVMFHVAALLFVTLALMCALAAAEMGMLDIKATTRGWFTVAAQFSSHLWARCCVPLTITSLLCSSAVAPFTTCRSLLHVDDRKKSIASLRICLISGFLIIFLTVKCIC